MRLGSTGTPEQRAMAIVAALQQGVHVSYAAVGIRKDPEALATAIQDLAGSGRCAPLPPKTQAIIDRSVTAFGDRAETERSLAIIGHKIENFMRDIDDLDPGGRPARCASRWRAPSAWKSDFHVGDSMPTSRPAWYR